MDKQKYLNDYKNARMALITIVIFTIVNCLLVYFLENFDMLFAITLPQLALILMDMFIENGFSELLVIVLYCVIPVGIYTLCYFKSKKNTKWLVGALVFYILDVVILLTTWILSNFDSSMIFSLVCQGMVLTYFIKGVKGAKALKGDLTEEQPKEVLQDKKAKRYTYNAQYAKDNNALKTKMYVFYWLGFVAIAIISTIVSNSFTEESSALLVFAVFGLTLLAMGFIFVRLLKIIPFMNVKMYSYYRVSNNLFREIKGIEDSPERFENIQFVKEKRDCYCCCYDKNGKKKELVIPKAYPNIIKILK